MRSIMSKNPKFISLLILIGASFSISTVHGRTDYEKNVIKEYENKCMDRAQMARDVSKILCQCASAELLKKGTILDLSKLSQPFTELSEEEAVKIENVDEDMYTLRELEIQIFEKCQSLQKKKKKSFSKQ